MVEVACRTEVWPAGKGRVGVEGVVVMGGGGEGWEGWGLVLQGGEGMRNEVKGGEWTSTRTGLSEHNLCWLYLGVTTFASCI